MALAAFFVFTDLVSAQTRGAESSAGRPIVIGASEKIKSVELGETRTINVYLPDGYGARSDTNHYPVIYLLDGGVDEDFLHICGLVQFLSGIVDTIPKCIIVGIVNIDRKRDLTYPTTIEKDKKDFPTTGGSAKFIAFIEKELQPYVTQKYKTNGRKIVIGQSLGGLLATEILLKKPYLFSDYLIVSPSLWWDNESLFSHMREFIKMQNEDKKRIFIAVGAEGDKMVGDAKKLAGQIKDKKDMQTNIVEMPAENHLTILHNAAYKGLEVLFAK